MNTYDVYNSYIIKASKSVKKVDLEKVTWYNTKYLTVFQSFTKIYEWPLKVTEACLQKNLQIVRKNMIFDRKRQENTPNPKLKRHYRAKGVRNLRGSIDRISDIAPDTVWGPSTVLLNILNRYTMVEGKRGPRPSKGMKD